MPDAQASPTPSLPGVQPHPTAADAATFSPVELLGMVRGAQSLLFYAAEAGIEVDDQIRQNVFSAAADIGPYSSPGAAAALVAGMTRVSRALSPVTANSLSACANGHDVQLAVKVYQRMAIILASLILPISLATFVTTSTSEAALSDITVANALAVKLTERESAPKATPLLDAQGKPDRLPREAGVIADLQALAGTTRAVDARARLMNWFVGNITDDPFENQRNSPQKMRQAFDLPANLPNLSEALEQRISTFQLVRQFAQSSRESIATAYGAVAVGILPILYALLGAAAYLLRSYQQQLKERTFTANDSHVARFVIAAIGGGVVGLFTNFSGGNSAASISPLAIAFLVGYATDVFFSFLDTFVASFNRAGGTPPKGKA